VNGLNQYTAAGPASFLYDSNGNLISDGSSSYVYDSENRLVSASGAKTASLAYDPLGRLWQTTGGSSGTTRFVYDGDRLVEEYDGAGNRPRVYVHGSGADEPLMLYELAGGPVHRYYHSDHQGSIVAVADDDGNALAINGYDPWGIPNAGNQGRFGYTGQAWIGELGLWWPASTRRRRGRSCRPILRPARAAGRGVERRGGVQRPFFCLCLSRSRTMLPSPSGNSPIRRATS
jgi:uncharacterized protein RhaS with RHS repeats